MFVLRSIHNAIGEERNVFLGNEFWVLDRENDVVDLCKELNIQPDGVTKFIFTGSVNYPIYEHISYYIMLGLDKTIYKF